MNKPMKLTAFLVTSAFIGFGLYDLSVCCYYGTESSVSRFMQTAGFTNPFIILVIGYILGHFWGFLRPSIYDTIKNLDEFKSIIDGISLDGSNKRQETISDMYRLYAELKKCRK